MSSHKTPATGRDEFAELQTEVLEWYGAEATERYVDLDRPAMRIHVVEAGAGHFPFHDAPDWTAERITGSLADD